ncbi:MAG TPA: GGDEF domain-containing protein [Myxococcota bacterium]|nr:GGDEF domain-containing protein [Myxococcota bacterium]
MEERDDDKTEANPIKRHYDPSQEDREAFLIVLSGASIGKMHRLADGENTVGRSRKCNVVLEEEGVSRIHARVEADDDGARIADNGSTNGTFVNGHKLGAGEQPTLRDGDRIMLGGSMVLRFSLQDELDESFQQQLYESAVRDNLTGAYNKRYLLERLEQEFSYAERHGTPLSLIVLDLDHFKKVNDTHGHAAGDEVLRAVADVIQGAARAEDIFARYGGEEFVLMLRETSLHDTMRYAERLRVLTSEISVVFAGVSIEITCSLGVASTDGAWYKSGRRLFVKADRNLYQAKQSGRNCIFGPERTKKSED